MDGFLVVEGLSGQECEVRRCHSFKFRWLDSLRSCCPVSYLDTFLWGALVPLIRKSGKERKGGTKAGGKKKGSRAGKGKKK